jgi:mannose/fructose/N-acetylgalactosamine-specific phosphotransferase system component IID
MTLKTLLNILWRSFFIQSCWNYKSLLSVGFCFSIIPIGRKLFKKDPEKFRNFLLRHFSFFNAHPYFNSYALGTVAALEEDFNGDEKKTVQIVQFKDAIIGPLGALGDRIFWVKIKPAVFTLGVLSFFLLEAVSAKIIVLFVLFLLYNVPHLYIRVKGIKAGYEKKFSIVKDLKIEKFNKLYLFYKVIGIISVSYLIASLTAEFIFTNINALIIFFMSIAISGILKSKLSKTYLAMTVPLVISVIIGFLKIL